jgi:hypothetical protein
MRIFLAIAGVVGFLALGAIVWRVVRIWRRK